MLVVFHFACLTLERCRVWGTSSKGKATSTVASVYLRGPQLSLFLIQPSHDLCFASNPIVFNWLLELNLNWNFFWFFGFLNRRLLYGCLDPQSSSIWAERRFNLLHVHIFRESEGSSKLSRDKVMSILWSLFMFTTHGKPSIFNGNLQLIRLVSSDIEGNLIVVFIVVHSNVAVKSTSNLVQVSTQSIKWNKWPLRRPNINVHPIPSSTWDPKWIIQKWNQTHPSTSCPRKKERSFRLSTKERERK